MKFMIVDDEPIVREGLKYIIDWEELGFSLCDEATDGIEAVSKIMDRDPDLVILDIKMPELSGVEVARKVREEGFSGKIIILSGFSDFTYAKQAINYGVDAYLLKPVDPKELIAALTRVKEKIEQELSLNVPPFQLVILDFSFYSGVNMESIYRNWLSIYEDAKLECIIIDKSIAVLLKGIPMIHYFNEHVVSYIDKMIEKTSLEPFVVISDSIHEINELSVQFHRMKNVITRKFFYMENNNMVFLKDLEIQNSDQINPIEFIDHIYHAIMDKDTSLMELSFYKLYRILQNRNFTIEQTFQVLINCMLELKMKLQETYIKEFINFNEKEIIAEICNGKTLYQIISLLKQKFIDLSKHVKNSADVNIVEKVLNYIDIHYNEELKLEKIAEQFGYNPAYLGRLLSQKIGSNFNLYIEKKRLDKAKELLIQTDIKIPDISTIIGYQNVEYFYRKFKKYTNYTPGNYRANHT